MLTRFLTDRGKHWIAGAAFCGMAGMAWLSFALTESMFSLPGGSAPIGARDAIREPAISPAGSLNGSAPSSAALSPSHSVGTEPPEARHALYAAADTSTAAGPVLGPVQASPPAFAGKVALTFDDGPDGKYTPAILDILRENDVKATFFVVGTQVSKFPEVLKRIHEEGHAIGNHSWDHADLSKLSSARIRTELTKTDEWIEKTVGFSPSLIRAPYGAVSALVKKEAERSERPLIGWNVDPRDWAGTDSEEIVRNVKSHTKPGGIILLHSFGGKQGKLDNTVEALPAIIAFLKENGYQPVTVPELKADR
ncbi:polysaccharide deacetylase family protein [Paenibacillus doosanensis]|uniref:polysaccharide deacetylase family protein n=1 Tax=Paenibacillus doosanensis TaxID=1229154 RepID=UPI00218083B3|nr:polysaccharide deacetylase family protein [Paenibacillus doosanensis]MCS7460459.1 polysaccharide deacetylase family protein [Paenibacillus doosanensis]